MFHASPRIPGLTENLLSHGYQITIVTPMLGENADSKLGFSKNYVNNVKIIEVPYKGETLSRIRNFLNKIGFTPSESYTEQLKEKLKVSNKKNFVDRLLWLYQEFFSFPDGERKWKKPAINEIKNFLKNDKFDFMLSSSPYPTSHVIANKIKKMKEIIWIADFRDTWTNNPVYPFSSFRKFFESKYEVLKLNNSDFFITVSDSYAKKLRDLHNKKVFVIPNGFQGSVVNKKIELTKKFTITYTGMIYLDQQNPILFFDAIKELVQEKKIDSKDILIRFFGRKENYLKNYIEKNELTPFVKQYGLVDRQVARYKQLESQLLLFFNWEDKMNKGLSHLKFYEYLKSGRPILASGGYEGTEVEKTLKETNAGSFCTSLGELKKAILNFYEEYKENNFIANKSNMKLINKHSYYSRATLLHKIMKDYQN